VSQPLTPPPDAKDWTWVLDRPCPDCGFVAAELRIEDAGAATRRALTALRARLADPDAGTRPEPQVWSPLEYACHVRDVCRIFGARLSLLRSRTDPLFVDWDQDETALADQYWTQHPDVVAAELLDEGELMAESLDSVRPDELSRPGRRSNGSIFTVDTLIRYFLHDLGHHVHDVSPPPPEQ
jgi:hypothetical protein